MGSSSASVVMIKSSWCFFVGNIYADHVDVAAEEVVPLTRNLRLSLLYYIGKCFAWRRGFGRQNMHKKKTWPCFFRKRGRTSKRRKRLVKNREYLSREFHYHKSNRALID